jgi:hypothetical protein
MFHITAQQGAQKQSEMENIIKLMAVCSFAINFIACNNSKTGKIQIGDKIHTVSIVEVDPYTDDSCIVTLHVEKEIKEEFIEQALVKTTNEYPCSA